MKKLNSEPSNKKEFHNMMKNINKYKIIKKLEGEKLQYANIGDIFSSDVLYNNDYNIIDLIEQGFIELIPDIFPFEKEIIGKNVHSVYSICPDCHMKGINFPLEKECGNCGYPKCITYYDAQTINDYINSLLNKNKIQQY